MKFTDIIFKKIIGNKHLINIIEWLDHDGSCSNWFIVRLLSCIAAIIILFTIIIPILGFHLIILNLEFYIIKIIFKQSTKISRYDVIKFKQELKPWLEKTIPYFKWAYIEVDHKYIIFYNLFYKEELIDICFLTKKERFLFELTWKGNVTFL